MGRIFIKMSIIVILLLIFFLGCSNKNSSHKAVAKKQLKETAKQINTDFEIVRREAKKLAEITKKLYSSDSIKKNMGNVDKSKYEIYENGVFYKPENDGKSAVFVSGFIPVDEAVKEVVYFTEPLDSVFKNICNNFPEIVQAYYNDENSYNRIYPYFDVLSQYEAKMEIPDFNFYYLADESHNPEKEGVWVNEPYIDPAGRGWMVSAIAPVYVDGKLMGVPGLDVTINEITDRYILKEKQNLMILDKNGVIVTTNNLLAGLFSLPPLLNHRYIETIKSDTYQSINYNLLRSKSAYIRGIAEKIMSKKHDEILFSKENVKYIILTEPIPELDWIILKVVKT